MSREPIWRRYLRLRGADPRADLEDELTHHLERRVAEYITRGMSRPEAERAAHDRLGDVSRVRRKCAQIARRGIRERRRSEWFGALVAELRHGARRLRRRPAFAVASTVTLGVGLGATTAIFAIVDSVLLSPLPYADPDRLVDVHHTAPGWDYEEVWQADGTYFIYRDQNRVFEDLGLWSAGRMAVTGSGPPEERRALQVTDGLLPILGVRTAHGRRFLPADDLSGAPPTIMLGHAYWSSRFGGDPGAVGGTLEANGVAHEIIGVLPQGFAILDEVPDLVVPFRLDRARSRITNFSYRAVGRLREGVTEAMAAADLDRLLPIAVREIDRGLSQEMIDEARMSAVVVSLKERAVGGVRRILWTLLGSVGVVLVISAANVAGLFMVRGESLQREVAVRAALGAGRRRAAKGFAVESALLGLAGGALGLVVARVGLAGITAWPATGLPRVGEISIGWSGLAFTVALSFVAALVLGRLTVARFGRPDLLGSLREGGRGGARGRASQRARSSLVVTQIALALVLLVGAGLMVRTLLALRAVSPGFERPERILTFRVSIPTVEEPDAGLAAEMHERILDRVRALPGVESAALVSRLPMEVALAAEDYFLVEDFPTSAGVPPNLHRFKWVSGDYFETMGNPVLAGRAITWADVRERANVVVITEDLALRYWGDARAAIGRRVRNEPDVEWREVVGVVGAVHDDGPDEAPVGLVYWPQVQTGFWGNDVFTQRSMAYVVRAGGGPPSGLVDAVRAGVWAVNPNLPLANVTDLRGIVRHATARTEFTVLMLAIAAGVAMLLGVIGLYGVVSFAVATRTREIGVRMALGAASVDVARMVVRQGAVLAGIGLAAGGVAALLTTRVLSALLFGVAALDVPTYVGTALLLGGVALLASYLPARRAARVEPTEALRHE